MTELPRLLVITDRLQAKRPLDEVMRAVCHTAGARWVLFRERDMEPELRRELARKVSDVLSDCEVRVSVSADPALALELGAAGVHLQTLDAITSARRILGADARIGFSAHSADEVRQAAGAGADYVTLSPIFPTESKPGHGPALGLETLRRARDHGIPILALGGVTPASARACREAGAHGIAVMGTVMRADDPARAIRAFAQALC